MIAIILSTLLLLCASAEPETVARTPQDAGHLQRYFEDPSLENLKRLTAQEIRHVVSHGIYEYMIRTECPQCLDAKAFGDTNTLLMLDAAYPLLDDNDKRQILMDYFRKLTLRQKLLRSDTALQSWFPQEASRLLDRLLTSQGLFGEALLYGIDEFEPFFCNQTWFNSHTTDTVTLRKAIEDHNLGSAIMNLKCRSEDNGVEYTFKDYLNGLIRGQKTIPKPPVPTNGRPSPPRPAITENGRRLEVAPCSERAIAREIRYFAGLLNEPRESKNYFTEIWFEIKDGTCSIMGALSRTKSHGFKFKIVPGHIGGISGTLVAAGEDELARMLAITFAD